MTTLKKKSDSQANRPIRILYVDDYPLDRELVRHALEKEGTGYQLVEATSREDFEARLSEGGFDLVLSDFNILGFDGLDVMKQVEKECKGTPVVIVTGTGSEEIAAKAIKNGAADYIIKTPDHLMRLPAIIESVLKKDRLEQLQRESQIKNQHLNSMLERIRKVNQLIVRERDRETLVQNACEILVEVRKHELVFIVLSDKEGKPEFVAAAASEGPGEQVAKELKSGLFPPCLEALSPDENVRVIDGNLSPCKDCGVGRTCSGNIVLSAVLRHGDQCYGRMVTHIAQGWDPVEQEISLFEETALDVGLALHTIAVEKERGLALRKVRENQEMMSRVLENLPLAVGLVRESQGKRSVDWHNTATREMLGYGLEELVGKSARNLYENESEFKRVGAVMAEIGGRNSVAETETVWLTKDGRPLNIHARWVVLEENGKGKTVLALAEDITEKKKMGDRLRQAQKMEAIGTLAGGIAHDFNNILSAIMGYTELAQGEVQLGSRVWNDLDSVRKAGNRAKNLVKQILAFSRQGEEEIRPILVAPVAKEALKLLRASSPSTVEFRQDIRKDLPPVLADPTQIHQVLMNLCTNAVYAMRDKGGVLEVTLTQERLTGASENDLPGLMPGDYVRLMVRDTGHGMGPSELERIFDPYYTSKPKDVGTGLGLSVVHGIVQSSGGDIQVRSEVGKGSMFEIYLPAIQGEEKTDRNVNEPIPTGNERILLVDDEESLRKVCGRMLQKLGYTVTTRTAGLEALELFRAKPDAFDLVITDLTMPHLTGDRLAGELMKIRADLPVILMTGFSEGMYEERAKTIGIKEFIMKPPVLHELAQKVKRSLYPVDIN